MRNPIKARKAFIELGREAKTRFDEIVKSRELNDFSRNMTDDDILTTVRYIEMLAKRCRSRLDVSLSTAFNVANTCAMKSFFAMERIIEDKLQTIASSEALSQSIAEARLAEAYISIFGYATHNGLVFMPPAPSQIEKIASRICRENGIMIGKMMSEDCDDLMYPLWVIGEALLEYSTKD